MEESWRNVTIKGTPFWIARPILDIFILGNRNQFLLILPGILYLFLLNYSPLPGSNMIFFRPRLHGFNGRVIQLPLQLDLLQVIFKALPR